MVPAINRIVNAAAYWISRQMQGSSSSDRCSTCGLAATAACSSCGKKACDSCKSLGCSCRR